MSQSIDPFRACHENSILGSFHFNPAKAVPIDSTAEVLEFNFLSSRACFIVMARPLMSFWKVFLFPAKINRVGDLCCSAVSPASDHPCTRNVTFQYYWYYAVPPSRVTRKVSGWKRVYFFLRGIELRNFLRGFWVIECNGSASRTKWSFRKQKPIILTAQFALIHFIGA